jgi:uncharacterized protein (UPF0548 family)
MLYPTELRARRWWYCSIAAARWFFETLKELSPVLFRFTPPSEDEARRFLSQQQRSEFSYRCVGATAAVPPPGYDVDHNRIQLGSGEPCWRRAVAAVRGWQMFNIPWIRLYWPSAPIKIGTVVAVSMRHFGFFSLNACRIAYTVDELAAGENRGISRFGFAYGTLSEHAESGEERFTVEWNRARDEVWYDILAFSRPRAALARLAYPLSRFLQRRFVRCSKLAMRQSASADRAKDDLSNA